jgi:hypothetical protein
VTDAWIERADLVGVAQDQEHPLFALDGAEIVECRSWGPPGDEVFQGSVRYWGSVGGTSNRMWLHKVYAAFASGRSLPKLVVERKRGPSLPWNVGKPFPVEEFDAKMRVVGDESLAAAVLTPDVRAWIAEHASHPKYEIDFGGGHVSIHTDAKALGNDDVAQTVARLGWSLREVVRPVVA